MGAEGVESYLCSLYLSILGYFKYEICVMFVTSRDEVNIYEFVF